MALKTHRDKLLNEGIDRWNQWRSDTPAIKPELRGVDLSRANLREANLHAACLTGVNLREANLTGADLSLSDLTASNLSEANLYAADLHDADLSSASLIGAGFYGASLKGAKLSGANLYGADLSRSNLEGTDMTGCLFGWTIFGDLDLSRCKGLEHARHQGPSTIGVDTLCRSNGNLPENFLRGAGVPQPFITHLAELLAAMDVIQFYSCFISYSTEDQKFAARLFADLQSSRVRCWFAPHDVQAGKKLYEQIDEAIRKHDKVLLVLSPASMASEWVRTEIAKARSREMREKRRVLFPIRIVDFKRLQQWECFDPDTGKDSAREIREYYIPDFSRWKSDDRAYQAEFANLLRDLRTVNQGERRTAETRPREPSSELPLSNSPYEDGLLPLSTREDAREYLGRVAAVYRLTAREHECLFGMVDGLTSKEIAQRMNVSPNTIKSFMRMIMIKMGVTTRAGLIATVMGSLLQQRAGPVKRGKARRPGDR
jgi:uncharacterized protein YjbI with pentapeptide repeats/DNA-binding CsgD family transcriptional regulator